MRSIQGLPFVCAFFLCYGSVRGGGFANGLFPPIRRDQLDDSPSSLVTRVLGLQWIKGYQDERPVAAYYSARNGDDDKHRSGFQNWPPPPPPPPPSSRDNPLAEFMGQLDQPIPNFQYGPPIMGNIRQNKPPSAPYSNDIWGRRPTFEILPNRQPWMNNFDQGRLINPVNRMWGIYNPQGGFSNGIRQSEPYGLGIINRQNSRAYLSTGEIQAPGVFSYEGGDPWIPRPYIMGITNPGNQITVRNPYGVGYPWVPTTPGEARGRYPIPPIPAPPMQYPVQRIYPFITGQYPFVYTNREDTLVEPSPDQTEHPVRQSGNQTKVQNTDDNISPIDGVYFRKRLDRTI